jgi:hypothetical protein
MGAAEVCQVHAELVRTRRVGLRTRHMTVTKIVGHGPGLGHAQALVEDSSPTQNQLSGRSVSRGPPALGQRVLTGPAVQVRGMRPGKLKCS